MTAESKSKKRVWLRSLTVFFLGTVFGASSVLALRYSDIETKERIYSTVDRIQSVVAPNRIRREKTYDYPLPNRHFFDEADVLQRHELKQRILAESPQLKADIEAKAHLRVVRSLREWAAQNVDGGDKLDFLLQVNRDFRTARHMIYLFDHDLLGVRCGDSSRFLKYVYELFDYPAETYNSGVYSLNLASEFRKARKTHVITLVQIDYKGQSIWVPQDCLFDVEYRLQGDECTDFKEFVMTVRSNPDVRVEAFSDHPPPERTRLYLDTVAARESANFDEIQQFVSKKTHTYRWNQWIKPDGKPDQLIRDVTGMKGHASPFHCFLFPIGNAPFDWLAQLGDFETQYHQRVAVINKSRPLR